MKNRKIATLIIGTVIAVTGVEAIGGSISSVKAMEEREKKIPVLINCLSEETEESKPDVEETMVFETQQPEPIPDYYNLEENTIFGYPAEEVIDVLERLVFSEAGNQSIEGQILVATTVVNRYEDSRFSNDFYEILLEYMGDWYSVTHEQVLEVGTIEEAVQRALKGEDPAAEPLGAPTKYFYNEETTKRWDPYTYAKIKAGVEKEVVVGDHTFYSECDWLAFGRMSAEAQAAFVASLQ